MEDRQIVDLLWARAEAAVSAMADKYGRLVYQLSRNIVGNDEDAAECVNDTWLGVWDSVPPHRPQVLSAYVCRIGRNVSLKRYRANTARKRNTAYDSSLEELENVLVGSTVEEIWSARELGRAIDRFLATLDRENRIIFVRRYWFADPVREIAVLMGMSENNISVRLARVRSRLRDYLKKEGIEW